MGPRTHTALLSLLFGVLGGWIGAMLFFGAAVAPAAFAVLPTPELAGRIVSRTLTVLNLGGVAAGTLLALLARTLGRGPTLVGLPLVLAAICLISHFGVSATLAELRADPAFAGDPLARARFAQLHGASVGLFGITCVGAILGLVLHARALAQTSRSPRKNAGNP